MMDAQKAREIYAKKKRSVRRREYGRLVHHEKAMARFRMAIELSGQGVSRDDAAQAVGLTRSGLNAMLNSRLGTCAWPIDPALAARTKADK